MKFSKTELKLLEQIAKGKKQVLDIAKTLKKDKSQIYRNIKKLEEKRFINLENKEINPIQTIHVQILFQELARQSSFIENISGCGLALYTTIINEPKSVDKIIKETGIKRSTIFYKIKKSYRNNLIKKIEDKYQFNKELWTKLAEFIIELEKYEKTTDKRIPIGSVIYHKTDKEIVFSTKTQFDATITGFSVYEKYGIKIYSIDNNYYLPKKILTKKEVFMHSLYRTENDKNIQNLILITLFYIKNKDALSEIQHKILNNINKVLNGEKIKDYPTLFEIKERAKVYDIKL